MMSKENNLQLPGCLLTAKPIFVPRGTRVFCPGDTCSQFYFLLSGSIRVDLLSTTGKAVLLYRFGNQESCTLTTACLFSGDTYCAEATVEDDATAYVLSLETFNKQFDTSTEFRNLVMQSFTKRLTDMMAKIDEIAFSPIDQRLARRLLTLADSDNGIDSTHQVIAADIGSAREVVSRKLAVWEQNGWLLRTRGSCELLDINKIHELAGNDS